MTPRTDGERPKPRLAFTIATGLGLGYLPKAPGTWGSAGAVVLVAGTAALTRSQIGLAILVSEFVLLLALAMVGLWSSQRVVVFNRGADSDPAYVVIDELSGQTIALVAGLVLRAWTAPAIAGGMSTKVTLAFATGLVNWKYLLVGFILFRVFDIWKPFPARRAEFLAGGLGIMADDWIAGAYAALGLWFAQYVGL